jgi:C4-dicarboxylate transporter, DctQ subunit
MNNGDVNYSQLAIQEGMASSSPLVIQNRMASILDQLTRLSFNLSGLALALMVFLIIYEVTMRYFFNSPTNWSSDVNQWLFALAIMLALPEITRANGNVAITIIIEKLSHHKKVFIFRAIAILAFVVCMAVAYIAGMESYRQYVNGIATMWVNPIPKWWISSVIPFGFFLSGVHFLREGIRPHPPNEI